MNFETNKTYVFFANKIDLNLDSLIPAHKEAEISWLKRCNGKIVKILSDKVGVIEIKGVEYKVIPKWTKVLDDHLVDAYCQRTNQVNPNKEEI